MMLSFVRNEDCSSASATISQLWKGSFFVNVINKNTVTYKWGNSLHPPGWDMQLGDGWMDG